MKKFLATIAAALFLGFTTFLSSVNAESTVSSLEKEIKETRTELSETNKKIEQINEAISSNESMLIEINSTLKELEIEKKELELNMEPIQERIQARTEILENRVSSIQETDSLSYLDVIFGSRSFSDFIDRISSVSTIMKADQTLMEDQINDLSQLDEAKEKIIEKTLLLSSKKNDLEEVNRVVSLQKEEMEKLKTQLKTKEKRKISEKQTLLQKQQIPTKMVSRNLSTGSIGTVINAGNRYIGNSVYVFGGGRSASDISNGRFDCSGFVIWAFKQAGVGLSGNTDSLKNSGRQVSTSEMKPGDLVFFDTYKRDGHVGIYIGGGKFIGSQSSTGVAVASMSNGYWKNTFNGRVVRIIN